jgi:hypothetical protein
VHIFIDTNILLGFYEMSEESLDEQEKIVSVFKSEHAQLWLPDQVKREFWNNREATVLKPLRDLERAGALAGGVPVLVREHAEYRDLLEKSKAVDKLKTTIAESVRAQISEEKTRADIAIRALFDAATEIDTRPFFQEANERARRRLPPGKDETIGDRITWIALLKSVPDNVEFHIISDDGGFEADGNKGEVRSYLAKEWQNKKLGGSVRLWKRISQFLAAMYPKAVNAVDMERSILVQRLIESYTFASTHDIVAQLSKLRGFTADQARSIANAVLNNSQVKWIAKDADVESFLKNFLTNHEDSLEPEIAEQIRKLIE